MKKRMFLAVGSRCRAGRLLQREARRRAGGRQARRRRRRRRARAAAAKQRGAGRRPIPPPRPRPARPTWRASSTSTTTATSSSRSSRALIEAHARFLKANNSRNDRHRGPHRRARRPRVQPGAGPAALRSRAPLAGPAGRAGHPGRGRELRQGKAGRAGQRRSCLGAEPPRRDRLPLMSIDTQLRPAVAPHCGRLRRGAVPGRQFGAHRPRCSRTTRRAAPSSSCASSARNAERLAEEQRARRKRAAAPQPAGPAEPDRDAARRNGAPAWPERAAARDLADVQRRQKDIAQGVDERLRKFEPVQGDGGRPRVHRRPDRAAATSRPRWRSSARATSPAAQAAFADFIKRYPQSGYRPTALFWLGNAQYANRDYRGAIANFRALLRRRRTIRARPRPCCPSPTARSS